MALSSFIAAATHNTKDLDITSAYTVPIPFVNTGSIFVSGNGSIAGNVTDANSLNIGLTANGNSRPINFTTGGNISGVPEIKICKDSSFTANHTISGITKNITIDSGANAVFNGLIIGPGALYNNGTAILGAYHYIRMDSGINNSGVINVLKEFTVPNLFNNAGIVNLLGGDAEIIGEISFAGTLGIVAKNYTAANIISGPKIINIAADASFIIPANTIFTLNSSLVGSGSVINNGILSIANNGNIDTNISGNGIIENNAIVSSIVNDLNTVGQSWISRGTVNVIGNRNILAESYAISGTHNFTITGPTVYDSITSNSNIDLSGGIINITSNYKNYHNQHYVWDIITGSKIITDSETVINAPESSNFHKWSSTVNPNVLRVEYTHIPFEAETPVEYADIAVALDYIASHDTNGTAVLARTLHACNCHDDYLVALDKLQPNLNVQPSHVAIQNATLNKVEMRVSGLRETSLHIPGIAYGDINPNTAFWMAGFASIANQKQTNNISGYRATAAGGLLGFDRKCSSDRIYGLAIGYSNSNIDGELNTDFNTRIIGYHMLAYGSNEINENNFYEWLATGITNSNVGSRQININNQDWSVTADYHTLQGGLRFNLGQYIDFDNWRFSQIETLRYTLLHQPSYDEVGSPAALHVANTEYSNILTLGLGYRISCTGHDAWAVGSREVRALVTYDVITSDNITTANFIAGGSDFTISNSASRLALQLGADYAFTFYDKLQLQLSYDFELRNQYTDNSFEVRFRYLF